MSGYPQTPPRWLDETPKESPRYVLNAWLEDNYQTKTVHRFLTVPGESGYDPLRECDPWCCSNAQLHGLSKHKAALETLVHRDETWRLAMNRVVVFLYRTPRKGKTVLP